MSPSPGDVIEMQILGLHSRPIKPKVLGVGPCNLGQGVVVCFLFFGCAHGMQNFLCQGSNPNHISDNTGFLTTRQPGTFAD